MSQFKRLVHEIHRRSLWQVLGLYGAASWVVIQVVGEISEGLALPDWVQPLAIVFLLLGFPIVLATAFVQEGMGGSRGPAESDPSGAATGSDAATGDASASGAAARSNRASATGGLTGATSEDHGVHHELFTWRNALLGGAAAFLLLGLLGAGYAITRALGVGPAATLVAQGYLDERDRIVLADFENRTSDSLLAEVVTEALRVDLAQSQVVRMAEPAFVAEALSRMERTPDARLSEALALELAQREGIKAVLSGEVGSAGAGFVLSAQLRAPGSGEILTSQRETASDSAEILPAIDRLSKRLRERIGESLRNLRADARLERVTTGDLEALRKYTQAVRSIEVETDYERGIALLEEAVALDTAFAMAWRKLGIEMTNRGQEPARALEAITRAYRHRDRLTERERYLATAAYHDRVTDEPRKAMQAYENMLELDPEDDAALNNLGGLHADPRFEDWDRAAELFQRALAIDSAGVFPYTNLAIVQVAKGSLDQAQASLDALEARNPGTSMAALYDVSLAAHRGKYDAARERLEALAARWRGDLFLSAAVADLRFAVAAIEGKLAEAGRQAREAEEVSRERGLPAEALDAALGAAWLDALVREDRNRAVRRLEETLERYPLDDLVPLDRPYLQLANLYAAAGRPERSRALIEEMRSTLDPEQRRGEEGWEANADAWLAIAEGRGTDAVEAARRADERLCPVCGLATLARAHDAAGDVEGAIRAYERYISTPWLFRVYPDAGELPHAHERLGELYDAGGNLEKAAEHYARFVELWQDADPELQPRVRAAQERLEQILAERG